MAEMKSLKTSMVTLAAIGAVAGLLGCEKKAKLSDDKGKGSYAIGTQIGRSLKAQNADVDLPSLTAGISDAIAGKEPKLKPDEMQASLMKMQEAAVKKASETAEKNQKSGEEFLAKNKEKEGVKTTESGLQYQVIQEGTGRSPKDNDTVRVHYTGTLVNGEKFDSSVDRGQPAEFPVNGVIPGWTEALKMMKEGGKWKLFIPPSLAYGPQGRPGIPPNSVLIFDVELIKVGTDEKPETAKATSGQ